MFIIGIDPHRGSHAAVVIDRSETVQATLELRADRHQRQRLLDWASAFTPRAWAVEGATGTGSLLAQQLVAVGERVIDVPPKLAARVRVLDNEQSDKSNRHDASSVAVAALRKRNLNDVAVEDHVAVLRLLAARHHDLVASRTRTVCRLHTVLCHLAEVRFPQRLRADQAAAILSRIHPTNRHLTCTARRRAPSARHPLRHRPPAAPPLTHRPSGGVGNHTLLGLVQLCAPELPSIRAIAEIREPNPNARSKHRALGPPIRGHISAPDRV